MSTSSGVVLQHGRREAPEPERTGAWMVQQLGQGRLVVRAEERLGVPDPDRADVRAASLTR